MPRLSDSMEEGTIVRWLKSDGDVVSKGEPIAEIETDKATVTCDADADGTLRIVAGEGQTVPLGGVIATIGDVTESRSGSPAPAHPRPAAPSTVAAGKSSESDNGADRVKASPLARRIARESQVDLRALTGSGPGGRIVKADVRRSSAGARRQGRRHDGSSPRASRFRSPSGCRVEGHDPGLHAPRRGRRWSRRSSCGRSCARPDAAAMEKVGGA